MTNRNSSLHRTCRRPFRIHQGFIVALLACLAIPPATANATGTANAAGTATVVLHPDGIVEASAITRGGSLAWSWTARMLDGWVSELSMATSETFDDDRDGVLRFEAPRAGWPIVMLIGVDTTTGEVVLATAAEDDGSGGSAVHTGGGSGDGDTSTWKPTLEVLDTVTVMRNTSTGAFSHLAFPGHRARVLLVRPGVGAWHLALSDGSALDRGEAADNLVELALEDMDVLAPRGTPAPSALAESDVVVVVDPQHMTARAIALSDASVTWDEEHAKPAPVAR